MLKNRVREIGSCRAAILVSFKNGKYCSKKRVKKLDHFLPFLELISKSVLLLPFILLSYLTLEPKAQASTTVNYLSSCKYIDSKGIIQVDSTCQVNFGMLGVSGGGRYIITFPNGTKVTVYISQDDSVEVNGINSDAAIAGGNVVITTEQGEIFIYDIWNP